MTCGLGTLENYLGLLPSTSDVYVLRLTVIGMPMQLVSEPLSVVEAVGRAFQSGILLGAGTMDYDIKGVAIAGGGTIPPLWQVDVMVTFGGSLASGFQAFKAAESLVAELNLDAKFKGAYPAAAFVSGAWYVLKAPVNEIAFWQSATTLFNHVTGKTTQAFDNAENLWWGTAEERKQHWVAASPPPIGPGPGQKPPPSWISKNWPWLALAGVGVGVVVYSSRRKR